MKILSLTFFLFLIIDSLFAQGNATSQANDEAFKKCVTGIQNASKLIDASFSLFNWAYELQQNVAQVLDNDNTEVLFEIADQAPYVDALVQMTGSCPMMKDIKSHLEKIKKIYNNKIKDKSKDKSTSTTMMNEERRVSFTTNDARLLKIHINSVVNILKGDKSLFKILR